MFIQRIYCFYTTVRTFYFLWQRKENIQHTHSGSVKQERHLLVSFVIPFPSTNNSKAQSHRSNLAAIPDESAQ